MRYEVPSAHCIGSTKITAPSCCWPTIHLIIVVLTTVPCTDIPAGTVAFNESYAIRCTFYSSGEDALPIFVVLVLPAIILERAETAVSICRLGWSAAVTICLPESILDHVLIYPKLIMNHSALQKQNATNVNVCKGIGDTKQHALFYNQNGTLVVDRKPKGVHDTTYTFNDNRTIRCHFVVLGPSDI